MPGTGWSAWSSGSTGSTRPWSPPKVQNLDHYLTEPAFRALVSEAVWQKAEYVRRAGNIAVHGNKTPTPEKALDVVRELAHVLYWAGRTYLRKEAENLQGKTFDESLVPRAEPEAAPASIKDKPVLAVQVIARPPPSRSHARRSYGRWIQGQEASSRSSQVLSSPAGIVGSRRDAA